MIDRTVVEPGRVVFHKVSGEQMYCEGVGLGKDFGLFEAGKTFAKVIRVYVDANNIRKYFQAFFSPDHLETIEGRELRDIETFRYLSEVADQESLLRSETKGSIAN